MGATKEASEFKPNWLYPAVTIYGYLHLAALYGIYLIFTSSVQWKTFLWTFVLVQCSIVGITAGAHRLWCHRSYKAKLPLQLILVVFNSIAFMGTITHWVKYHRMHHKYADTDGDPHNSKRGLFFSQFGWLLVEEHPEVKKKESVIFMDDVLKDPVLKFQHKYAWLVIGLWSYVIPTVVPMYFWGESLVNSWHICSMLRQALTFNLAYLVNSVGHKWGSRPFDKNIRAVENTFVSTLVLGECFHNYHHVFPFDYKASELGMTKFNVSTMFINFFAAIGWAYDLKTIPDHVIAARSKRTGDDERNLWGWGDNDQTEDDTKNVELLYSKSQ